MKIFKVGLLALLLGSGLAFADETIVIAASPVPQADILKQIKPMLKQQGIDLQVKEFSDYVQPNLLVQQKQLDANFFQHRPYLAQFNKEHHTTLVELAGVHIEPMGIYASKDTKMVAFANSKDISKLPKGIAVGVPNDTTNEGRALLLLQQHGILTIKAGIKFPTKKDIVTNPYNVQIKELDPGMLSRTLVSKQLDLAVINSNYALQSGLNPTKDAIYIEDAKSPYVNIIAVRPDELNEPKMKALAKAINSQQVKDYINKTYKGAVVPAF